MRFIEMTGKVLATMLSDDEMQASDLKTAGVNDETIVRVNEHGDIEVRRDSEWDVVGGLLGNYEDRVKQATGRDWA
ncbi:MAG: hypothetical protein VB862_13790 [Pirellulaceae bacterium]|jgi:hypothetical protein|nr:hypothetical protein [Planctomycetota bacterium]